MQRTSDFDLMVASQLAGDSAMFALLGGKRDPKRPTDHEAITGQEPTKEVATAEKANRQ